MLQILRVAENEHGTFSVLLWDQRPFAVSLEPRWKNNEENISCIPSGQYMCSRVQSPTFGETFEVIGVPGRTNVLFHWGNRIVDTEGCILVAEEFGKLYGDDAVLSSRRGFNELMKITKEMDGFNVLIRYVFAGGSV